VSEPAADGANTAITEALWRKVLDNFDDDTVHAKFIQHCSNIGDLPDAAKRYRDHRDALGDADEVSLETVDKRLNAVTLLAVAQLDVQRGTQPRRHPLVWVLTVTVALMLGAAIIGLLRAVML
jgi:hypothetical protein